MSKGTSHSMWCHRWTGVMICIRMQSEQAKRSESVHQVPLQPLLHLLSLSSWLDFLHWWIMTWELKVEINPFSLIYFCSLYFIPVVVTLNNTSNLGLGVLHLHISRWELETKVSNILDLYISPSILWKTNKEHHYCIKTSQVWLYYTMCSGQ